MDGLVAIIIVWAVIGVIRSGINKKVQSAKKAAGQAQEPKKAPAPQPKKSSVWEQIEMMGMLPKDDEPEEKPSESPAEGVVKSGSISDYVPMSASFEGLGKPGSLAADMAGASTFDESFYKDDESKAPVFARSGAYIANVSSRDMKSAVVMSEILGRPVAMRRGAGAFQRRRS